MKIFMKHEGIRKKMQIVYSSLQLWKFEIQFFIYVHWKKVWWIYEIGESRGVTFKCCQLNTIHSWIHDFINWKQKHHIPTTTKFVDSLYFFFSVCELFLLLLTKYSLYDQEHIISSLLMKKLLSVMNEFIFRIKLCCNK